MCGLGCSRMQTNSIGIVLAHCWTVSKLRGYDRCTGCSPKDGCQIVGPRGHRRIDAVAAAMIECIGDTKVWLSADDAHRVSRCKRTMLEG